ncbi:dehydrogenase [Blastopirellula marina]|uniref:Dehydrogenase n=1 Tax=Blastopirellula marina TaxID=124 RepID=A0A2S8GI37_9BACT|nr:dehydrogenase [Blastopirellula marina]
MEVADQGRSGRPARPQSESKKKVTEVQTAAADEPAKKNGKSDQPKFKSKVVTTRTPGHAVDIDVDITGAKQLYLVVSDGGDGFSCDWADWIEPTLIGPSGEKKLTDLNWKSAVTQWRSVNKNRNVDGSPLRVNGELVVNGIGTHANSIIAYDLPEGYTRFKAKGGLDNGGSGQQGGETTSVAFAVYTAQPPAFSVISSGETAPNHEAENALAGLDVHEGLEATLSASEPTLKSLTNLDVDHRGRVWVCDVMNYRGNNGSRPEGDRILILEDEDGDGVCEKSKVYYQGRDVDTAMGICVLGNKVIVSATPNIIVFTDTDGDDKPDQKELLFTKTGQPQHDHSCHSFLFGPDGKLYWNFGNTGRQVFDKEGKPVVDIHGREVVDNGHPFFGGMPFRCNLDGSEFEVLAHNFRNNYEATVDSFGTVWQSDNDDDGNRGVRINYVMEEGNFGYLDQMTGAGWREPRTGMSEEIPLRHWHLNDPGVVPNFVQTGAGSPTGICVYEGRLLPQVFWDQVIHCDAGPNVVRAYPAQDDGAGYKGEMVNILHGARDNWFRPADVCVAPDGSLFVSDWYDPGVGGHGQRDLDRGRLFRVAPKGERYTVPKFDFDTIDGALAALENPNLSVRYMAWTSLHNQGAKAEAGLKKMFETNANPRIRARALWLLAKIDGKGPEYVEAALADKDADIRITGLRIARQLKLPLEPLVAKLVNDPSPQVRREAAISLRWADSPDAAKLWAQLAAQHDGEDRWYLEALGIGADLKWDACLDAYLSQVNGKWNTPAGRDIVWRSRASKTPGLLAAILEDPATPYETLPRYFRAFDFQEKSDAKNQTLADLAFSGAGADDKAKSLILSESISRLGGFDVSKNPQHATALKAALAKLAGTSIFVELVDKFNVQDRYGDLLAIAQAQPNDETGVAAMKVLLDKNQRDLVLAAINGDDLPKAIATTEAVGNSAAGPAIGIMQKLVDDGSKDLALRRIAVKTLAANRGSANKLVALAKAGKLDPALMQAAAAPLTTSTWQEVRDQANAVFPAPPSKDNQPLPSLTELAKMRGDAANGQKVFAGEATCAKCHIVNDQGKEVGPNLSEIGSKLSREAMFESILYPSAGISHNYENFAILLDNGTAITGLLVSETDEKVTIKNQEGLVRSFSQDEIEEMKKLPTSLMPADLQKLMTVQELVDVAAYLETLKKKN